MYIVKTVIGTIVAERTTMENICEILAHAKRDCVELDKLRYANLYGEAREQIVDEMRRIEKLQELQLI